MGVDGFTYKLQQSRITASAIKVVEIYCDIDGFTYKLQEYRITVSAINVVEIY
jgi:hypothetical protein